MLEQYDLFEIPVRSIAVVQIDGYLPYHSIQCVWCGQPSVSGGACKEHQLKQKMKARIKIILKN